MLLVSICFVLYNLQKKSHPMLSRTCPRTRTITVVQMHVCLGFLCLYICVWTPPKGVGDLFSQVPSHILTGLCLEERKHILVLVSGRWCIIEFLWMHVLLRLVCFKVSVWNSFNGVLDQFDSVASYSRNKLIFAIIRYGTPVGRSRDRDVTLEL